MSHASTAASVRRRKEALPWLFCGEPRCLWYVGQSDSGPPPCPKHPTVAAPLLPYERETCEHCGCPIAVKADGEMHWQDPRCALLCKTDETTATFCEQDPKRPGAPHRKDCPCGDCYVDQDEDR